MQRIYLGSVVVRPIPEVPIGRTVLRVLEDDPERQFKCIRPYICHFLGLNLTVNGLAFQQQDQAVGACATTALWSALSRVCHVDGYRAPTPMAITEAAVRHLVFDGRLFPSTGLTVEQMYEALRAFEFGPDVFLCRGHQHEFKTKLNIQLLRCYLDSGIPAVMTLEFDDGGWHAVTAVGYRASVDHFRWHVGAGQSVDFGPTIDCLYINDDRLGPYARAGVAVGNDPDGLFQMELRIARPGRPDELPSVNQVMLPLYSKLHMTAFQLFDVSVGGLWPLAANRCGVTARDPEVNLRFAHSGEYLADLPRRVVGPVRASCFVREASLSRYVGITEYSLAGSPLLDAVWDTTDRIRETDEPPGLLGLVARDAAHAANVDALATELGVVSG